MLQRATNYYDDLFPRLIGDDVPLPDAVERVATAYLDQKPLPVGKKKITKKERESAARTPACGQGIRASIVTEYFPIVRCV
jgi:hypothetical protein